MLVGVLEPAGRFDGDADRRVHRELPLAAQPVAQRLAFDKRHREPEPARGLAGVEYGEDVGMLEPSREPDLPLEALGAERGGELRMEHLEGDRPVVPEVLGEIDRGHAPAAELALQRVPIPQPFAKRRYRVSHCSRCVEDASNIRGRGSAFQPFGCKLRRCQPGGSGMSIAWTLLIVAGLLEVVWAVGLKYTEGFTRLLPSAITLTAMLLSIVLLARALRTIPVGTGYAVWTGIGAVGTALVGILVLGEPRDSGRLIALCTIIGGIVGLKLTSPH